MVAQDRDRDQLEQHRGVGDPLGTHHASVDSRDDPLGQGRSLWEQVLRPYPLDYSLCSVLRNYMASEYGPTVRYF